MEKESGDTKGHEVTVSVAIWWKIICFIDIEGIAKVHFYYSRAVVEEILERSRDSRDRRS